MGNNTEVLMGKQYSPQGSQVLLQKLQDPGEDPDLTAPCAIELRNFARSRQQQASEPEDHKAAGTRPQRTGQKLVQPPHLFLHGCTFFVPPVVMVAQG